MELKMLVKHVRHPNNTHLIGTVVALNRDTIGWSQCNPKDTFNKALGVEIAVGRANKGSKTRPVLISIPIADNRYCKIDVIHCELVGMTERAKKYFKQE